MQLSKIGQFYVQKEIAEGGQAKIYETIKDSEIYAIKVYHSSNQKDNLLFSHQKQLMESLNHKGIFSPLQYRANETITLTNNMIIKKNIVVMRYMKNGDLMNFVIKNIRINERIILRLLRSILDCLQYLSSKDIFHCDIKPENILLNEKYQPLLIDFGFIASKFSARQKEYPKQYYIAPEVKKGQPYTEKSEAFSLGVLIFILSVGCLPFKQTKHTDSSYRSLLEGKHNIFWKNFQQNLNFPLDQNLKKVIISLMQPNPKRRWGYQQLRECEWFNQQIIGDNEYMQYFEQKYENEQLKDKSMQQIKKQQTQFQFPFTDNEQTASKQMMEEQM